MAVQLCIFGKMDPVLGELFVWSVRAMVWMDECCEEFVGEGEGVVGVDGDGECEDWA